MVSRYPNHQVQLFAYCLLVEDACRPTVRAGVLRYSNREVRLDYTADKRAWVLEVLAAVRAAKRSGSVTRNHAAPKQESCSQTRAGSWRSLRRR
jgi:CRISPR-associated exonuclease Cas4